MREVTERDLRMPEFRDAKPEELEFREDGKLVRKDRWEVALRNVASAIGWARREFEVHEVSAEVSRIKELADASGTNTQRGLGLLMALRRAEAELQRYREEDTDLHRELHRKDSEHRQALLREEEKGYERGLRDGANLPVDFVTRKRAPEAAAPMVPSESRVVRLGEHNGGDYDMTHRTAESGVALNNGKTGEQP